MIPGKFLKDAMIPMHLLAQAMAKLPPISERRNDIHRMCIETEPLVRELLDPDNPMVTRNRVTFEFIADRLGYSNFPSWYLNSVHIEENV
jgi:hypothetical protein